jgi:hypothetical protein
MRILLLSLFLIFIAKNSFAEDVILRESNKCERYFHIFEKQYNIPKNLLKSVSIIESGIHHKESSTRVPWPWTINVKGKGYFFDNKNDAIEAVKKHQKAGIKSIDIGCMQVNLYYHPKAFEGLEHAFEPVNNIEYAAKFIKSNFEKHMSWRLAVAAYHSETRELGHPYAEKVVEYWRNIHGYETKKYAGKYKSNYRISKNIGFIRSPAMSKKSIITNNYNEKKQIRRQSNMFIKIKTNDKYNKMSSNKKAMISNITKEIIKKN